MPLKCHIYVICPNYLMYINEGSRLIHLQYINSLASTIWYIVLYTEDYDPNTDNENNVAWLHKLSWPLANSAKNSGQYDSLKAHTQRLTIFNSIHYYLTKPNPFKTINPLKVKTVENESLQKQYTLAKWKTAPNQFFQDHHMLPNWKLPKLSPLSRSPHSPNVKIIQNE